MSKAEKEIAEINERIEEARNMIAVIWEENKIAIKSPEEYRKAPTIEEDENNSQIVADLKKINNNINQLLFALNSLRECMDL